MQSRKGSKWLFYIPLMTSLAFLPGAVGKDHTNNGNGGSARFRGLDRNNDGVITRDEWRGNDRSFSVHDRNGDRVLSGAEIGDALQAERYDDFLDIDRDRDGRISRNEWRWEPADFNRLDQNQDGWLTRPEYMGTAVDNRASHFPDPLLSNAGTITTAPAPVGEDRNSRFARLDSNGDGRISRAEWGDDKKSFNALDDNDNGMVSREEYLEVSPAERKAMFKEFDRNGNGVISKAEWTGDKQSFGRFDTNNDGKLMREEFTKRYHVLEQKFRSEDRDNNGQLSREEWRGDKKAFEKLDDNHDGRVSFNEFVVAS